MTLQEFAAQHSQFVQTLRDELASMGRTLTPSELDYLTHSGPVQREYLGYCIDVLFRPLLSFCAKWMAPR